MLEGSQGKQEQRAVGLRGGSDDLQSGGSGGSDRWTGLGRKGKISKGEKYSAIMVLSCYLASHAKTEWLKKQRVIISHNSVG